MYEVWIDHETCLNASPTLEDAMKFAKGVGKFVVIRGNNVEIAGVFGVGEPDADYKWSKDYSLGKRKSKKEWKRDETKDDR